mmetsp:Transcript_33023/g.79642  ORF Transcript_33023/g.79642 Transcript_33023/m.79642 type:complete len:99 (-) Transcript_33023:75-371(-)
MLDWDVVRPAVAKTHFSEVQKLAQHCEKNSCGGARVPGDSAGDGARSVPWSKIVVGGELVSSGPPCAGAPPRLPAGDRLGSARTHTVAVARSYRASRK